MYIMLSLRITASWALTSSSLFCCLLVIMLFAFISHKKWLLRALFAKTSALSTDKYWCFMNRKASVITKWKRLLVTRKMSPYPCRSFSPDLMNVTNPQRLLHFRIVKLISFYAAPARTFGLRALQIIKLIFTQARTRFMSSLPETLFIHYTFHTTIVIFNIL